MSKWFTVEERRPNSEVRLIGFPFAGASATAFRGWSASLPPEVELWVAHLPGRAGRLAEPAFDQIEDLVEAAADALVAEIEPPFVFFGHSMGAIVAYELARHATLRGWTPPLGVLLSAAGAPETPASRPPIHALTDHEFVDAIRELGGTPSEVFEHPELVALLLPTLRADFAVVETYDWSGGPRLTVPIVAYAATDDAIVDVDSVRAWGNHTQKRFDFVTFEGDHFFLLGDGQALVTKRVGEDVLGLLHGVRRHGRCDLRSGQQ